MENNSLLVCIEDCDGYFFVNGQTKKLLRTIKKDKIVTSLSCPMPDTGIFKYDGSLGVVLAEDGGATHPITNIILKRNIKCFRELQPPLSISISDLLPELKEHAATALETA